MNIERPEEFAKQLQSLVDIVDLLRQNCLPTQQRLFDKLERQGYKLMELVEEKGGDPEVAINNHFITIGGST